MAANVALYERLLPPGVPDLSRWPDLVAEIEGIAAGAGVPVAALLRMQARTELLGGAECSLIGRAGRVEQTWDWHPDVRWLVWVVEQGGGRWFATLTEAGIVAKLGLSSAGLCFGLNFLRCSLDGGFGGVPIHVLLRLLLDRVESFDDALAVLTATTVTASSCISVGSAREVVAVELSPGGCRLVRAAPLVHTNHFLARPPVGEDVEDDPSTFARLAALERIGSLRSVRCYEDPDVPWPDRRATLASVVMEPGVPRLRVDDREVPLP